MITGKESALFIPAPLPIFDAKIYGSCEMYNNIIVGKISYYSYLD